MASKTSPRDRLLETATNLFYQKGTNVGINEIIKEADVARMTLYKHFESKDALVEAVLEQESRSWLNSLAERVDASARKPTDKPTAAFKVLEEDAGKRNYRGSTVINFMVDAADSKSGVHKLAQQHDVALQDMFEGWLKEAKLKKAKRLSRQLAMLLNGAVVTAQIEGDGAALKDARTAAQALITAAQ